MSIDVTTDGDLERKRWSFTVGHNYTDVVMLRLRTFSVEERASKRHKWRPVKLWDSMNERGYHSNLKREEVVIPEWVKVQARGMLQIEVPDVDNKLATRGQ